MMRDRGLSSCSTSWSPAAVSDLVVAAKSPREAVDLTVTWDGPS